MKWLIAAAVAIGVGAWIGRRSMEAADSVDDDMPDQSPDLIESIATDLNPMNYIEPDVSQGTAAANIKAFLDMIAYAEGTSGTDGYRTLFGGGLFDSYADHPRRVFTFTNRIGQTLRTTAAGRYQFLARTWDGLKAKLGLTDFGPANQDAAAIELIRERGALNDVKAGRFVTAVNKCAPVWASLPGAGYNQPERKLSTLVSVYTAAGGNLEA